MMGSLEIHLFDNISQVLSVIKASPLHNNLRLCGCDGFEPQYLSLDLVVLLLELLELHECLIELVNFLLLLKVLLESVGVGLSELLVVVVKVLVLGLRLNEVGFELVLF